MYAQDHINLALPKLSLKDEAYKALQWMSDFHIKHLPVVNGRVFLGMIDENQLLEVDDDTKIAHFEHALNPKSILPNEHILEAVKFAAEWHYEIVPVADEKGNYIGVIDDDTIVAQMSTLLAVQDFGGILILEVNKLQYSLHEIVRIIEAENIKIINILTYNTSSPETIHVLIKLNSDELHHLISSFERFNYHILATFKEHDYQNFLKDRYDSLIHYLNI